MWVVSKQEGQRDLAAGLRDYVATIDDARQAIEAEPVPPGLKAFHGKLLEALTLQQTFFTKAVEASDDGQPWEAVIAIPEGKQASSLLINAWGDMQRRYPGWTPAVKDSVYHHLCALDLF